MTLLMPKTDIRSVVEINEQFVQNLSVSFRQRIENRGVCHRIPWVEFAVRLLAVGDEAHTLEVGEHRIVLKHPGFLGEGGFVHVGDKEGMVIFLDEEYNQIGQNKEVWIELFFYPEFGGGYRYALIIDDGEKSWWTWITPELTYNYDLYDAASRPAEEIEIIEQLLVEHRDEIISLFDTVKNVWGIEFLTVT